MDQPRYPMLVLSGEQIAPNLLPARHFQPSIIHVFHTDFPKSKQMAERLRLRLPGSEVLTHLTSGYNVGQATSDIRDVLRHSPNMLVNVTGGTKPMSFAAMLAAKEGGNQVFYVRSEKGQTELDFYGWTPSGKLVVRDTTVLGNTITIDDYLTAYFGVNYQFTSFGTGAGEAFERALFEALQPPSVDEICPAWKHESGVVDVDFIVRCNNQVGIIEAKTGGAARKTDGIRQLAVAGGQRFFGTYTHRFLVIDQTWPPKASNRTLAEAIGITVVELPSFGQNGVISTEDSAALKAAIHRRLGSPTTVQASS